MDILTDEDRDLLDRDAERPEAYDEPRECRWHAEDLDADGICPACEDRRGEGEERPISEDKQALADWYIRQTYKRRPVV